MILWRPCHPNQIKTHQAGVGDRAHSTCKIEIHGEPTLADLFWDIAGQKDDPKEIHPRGLAKGE